MKKKILILAILLLTPSIVYSGQTFNPFTGNFDSCVTVKEEDGSPSNITCADIKVSNGSLVDNGDGSFSLTTSGAGGGGSNPIIQNNDVTNVTSASIIDFSSQFVVTEDPTNEANIVIGSNAITASNVTFIGSATGNAGYIFVADGTDFESVALSGDMTVGADGVTTIQANAIGSSEITDGSIDETDLDTSVNASLDLADSALQGNQTITLSGSVVGSGATSIPTVIATNAVTASNIDFIGTPNEENSGYIFISDGADYQGVALSGDITVNVAGLTTIQPNAIGSSEIVNNSITYQDVDSSIQASLDLADSALQAEVDGSTTNEIQTFDVATLISDTLSLSLSSDGEATKTFDLSPYLDNTDTNASSVCNGDTTYFSGEGNCNDLSSVYQPLDADLTDLADGSLTGTKVGFADTNSDFTATDVQSAIEELVSNNGSGPNAADGKVSWTQLVDVPAGFSDGTDDGSGGGSGDDVWVNTTNVTTAKFTDNPYFDFIYDSNAKTVQIMPVANSFTAGILADVYLTAEVDGSTSNELQNLFNTVTVAGETPIIASSQTDTLELVPGLNMSITTVNGTVVFSSTDTDTDTQLTQEQVEDFVGNMLDGTETLITVDYDDINNSITFVVDNDLANYDNTNAGFLDTSTGISSLADVGSTSYGVGSLLVADGDSYEEVVMSGDATINASGVLTIDDSTITITESQISDLAHTTDTNANTICTGTTTYLDGEGNCDDISSVYESATSNDIDPDRLAGDTTDDNLIDDAIIASTIARDSELHDAATVSDTSEIDLTITGQQISGVLVAGSIDETKLDTSTNASLDLADSATQPGDGLSTLTNDAGYLNTSTVISALADVGATDYTAGQFLVADGNSFEQVAMSGDATLSASGVLTVANNSITAGMLQATNSPTDNYVPTFDLATGGVTWDVNGAGGGDSVTIDGASITDPDFRSDAQISFVDNSNTVVGYINPNAITANNLYDTGLFTREVQLTLVEQATNVTSTLGISNSFYAGNVLTGYDVTWGKAYVDTAGVTGSTTANLYNVRGSCYMFTGGLVIASGSTSSSAGTVNTSCDDINEGDEIRPDVTGVSSTAPTGLTIIFDAKKP